jgi:polygalacturonase
MHANDTLVENCFFGTGHGASIGSLGAGTFLKNITVRNISIRGAVQALRIKADPTSSGFLRDVLYQNLALANCGTSIYMTMDYTLPSLRGRFGSPSLKISNVTFADIVSRDATAAAGLLDCDAASPCVDVMFRNITHVGKQPKTAWTCVAIHGQVQDPVTPPLTCVSPRSSPD